MARALGLKHPGCPHLSQPRGPQPPQLHPRERLIPTRPWEADSSPQPRLGSQEHAPGLPGMEFLPGNSDFLSPNLEAQGDSVESASVLPSTLRRLLSPPRASPHAAPLTSGLLPFSSLPALHPGSSQLFLADHGQSRPLGTCSHSGVRGLALWLAFTSPSPAWESQTAPRFTAGKTEAQRGEGPGL